MRRIAPDAGALSLKQLQHRDPQAAAVGTQISAAWNHDGDVFTLSASELAAAVDDAWSNGYYYAAHHGQAWAFQYTSTLDRLSYYLRSTQQAPGEATLSGPVPERVQREHQQLVALGRPTFSGVYPPDLEVPPEVRDLDLQLPFPAGTRVICTQGNNSMWAQWHEDPNTGVMFKTHATHAPDNYRYALDFVMENPADTLGAPVTAAAPGTAYVYDGARVNQPDNWGLGNMVIVDHGNGYATLYSHLDELSVENGARVDRSTQLGTMGSTGNAGVPHLHFHVVRLLRTPNPDAEKHQVSVGNVNWPAAPFDHRDAVRYTLRTSDGGSGSTRVIDSNDFENTGYGLYSGVDATYVAP